MSEEIFAAQDDTTAAETTETTEETKEETAAETKEETQDTKEPSFDPAKLTIPEGFEGLDQAAMQEFLPIAQGLNLSQEQAQQFVNLHASAIKGAFAKIAEQQTAANEAGIAEVKALFGNNYDQNMGKIQHLLKEYGGEDAANQPVYGNKALMSALLKIAEDAGPGRFITGKQSSSVRDADLLFDSKGD